MFVPGVATQAVAQQLPAASRQSDAAAGQVPAKATSEAQTAPVIEPDQPQGLVRIVPFGRGNAGIKSQAAPAGAHLTYFGGPVISNIQVVVVFWGPNVNAAVTANGTIDQFYTDITTSRFFDELTEYTTAGVTNSGGVSSNQTIGHGTFAGGMARQKRIEIAAHDQMRSESDLWIGAAAIDQKIIEHLKRETSLSARALMDSCGDVAGAKFIDQFRKEVGGQNHHQRRPPLMSKKCQAEKSDAPRHRHVRNQHHAWHDETDAARC